MFLHCKGGLSNIYALLKITKPLYGLLTKLITFLVKMYDWSSDCTSRKAVFELLEKDYCVFLRFWTIFLNCQINSIYLKIFCNSGKHADLYIRDYTYFITWHRPRSNMFDYFCNIWIIGQFQEQSLWCYNTHRNKRRETSQNCFHPYYIWNFSLIHLWALLLRVHKQDKGVVNLTWIWHLLRN